MRPSDTGGQVLETRDEIIAVLNCVSNTGNQSLVDELYGRIDTAADKFKRVHPSVPIHLADCNSEQKWVHFNEIDVETTRHDSLALGPDEATIVMNALREGARRRSRLDKATRVMARRLGSSFTIV